MPFVSPGSYRKTRGIIRRDTRANQPNPATEVLEGTLYYVTDEGVLERSNGTTWESYDSAFGGPFTNHSLLYGDGTNKINSGDAASSTDLYTSIGYVYKALTTINKDVTNPLINDTDIYVPLRIGPTLTQNTNKAGIIEAFVYNPLVKGTGNFDSLAGTNSTASYNGSGTITNGIFGLVSAASLVAGTAVNAAGGFFYVNQDAGTITNIIIVQISSPILSGGTRTNLYGLKIEDQTGATNNWAIKTELGKVQLGDIVVLDSTIRLNNYTVATLPVGVQGDVAYVTDALGPTYLTNVVGGGAIKCPVFYNGTNWVCH